MILVIKATPNMYQPSLSFCMSLVFSVDYCPRYHGLKILTRYHRLFCWNEDIFVIIIITTNICLIKYFPPGIYVCYWPLYEDVFIKQLSIYHFDLTSITKRGTVGSLNIGLSTSVVWLLSLKLTILSRSEIYVCVKELFSSTFYTWQETLNVRVVLDFSVWYCQSGTHFRCVSFKVICMSIMWET